MPLQAARDSGPFTEALAKALRIRGVRFPAR